MGVTTVSPSPASLTGGHDLCETDVTNVAIHSVTLLICLCGLLGNGAVLRLLSLKLRNLGIFDLAFADCLFMVFTVPSTLLFLVDDVSCSPIVPLLYVSFLFQLSVASCYLALFRLMDTSKILDVCMLCILCLRCCDLPNRLWWMSHSVRYCIFIALFAVIPIVTNLCPSQQQWQCRAALISMYAIILLLCAAPVVIFRTIDFIRAKWGSKKHQSKRPDIVIFLMLLFIFLLSLCNFLKQFGYTVLSSEVLFLLNYTHSSIKPFIYFLAGGFRRPCSLGSFRLSLQRVFDEQEEEAAHTNDAPMDTGI